MSFNCLIINAGSSSLKFRLYKTKELIEVTSGICEKISIDGIFNIEVNGKKKIEYVDFKNHDIAIEFLIKKLLEYKFINSIEDITIIANRIVHGGERFKESVILNDNDIDKIQDLGKFAPLHNPPAISVIKSFKKICKAKHVGVFDTSFHQTIPRINYEYAIFEKWRKELGIRKYGMHGTSFKFIVRKAKEILKKKEVNLIVCHLGNGASLCAIKNNKSYNTSMGLTPLAGLVMGTRSGDVDPSIFSYIERMENKSAAEIENILNKESGVKAFAGSSDMRDVEKAAKSNNEAKFAFEIWSKRIADYISIYLNDLQGKVDALVFTAGIGENSSLCRKYVLDKIKGLGFEYSEKENDKRIKEPHLINSKNSKYKIYIIPTDEELMMALDAKKLFFKN